MISPRRAVVDYIVRIRTISLADGLSSAPVRATMTDRLGFASLTAGQRVRHAATRTLTEADNLLASVLIMSSEPLQLDAVFAARASPSGERLVNSVFTLGLMIGISGHDFAYAQPCGFEDAHFPNPGRIGDTIRIESIVLDLDPPARTARLRHHAITHRGDTIATATRRARFV